MDGHTLSYIATNLDELMEQARPEVKELIEGKDIDEAVAVLGKIHKLPISSYMALDNLILFILLGALKPEDVVHGIMDILKLSEEDAYKLAADMDKSILEKARIRILDKAPTDMVTLTFKEGRSADELRKEILDTTKREPAQASATSQQPAEKQLVKQTAVPGSRSQLMEQLQVLGEIPDDEEVAERLKKIQEQVSQIQSKEEAVAAEPAIDIPPPEAVKIAVPETKAATYSKAPTKYNVDPYREVAE